MNLLAATKFTKEQGSHVSSAVRAFTLLELLVVIVIIGLLATIGLPAIKGMTKSNALASANRQLLDDISFARSRAISDHTVVYLVFIPPNITDTTAFPLPVDPALQALVTNLYPGQYNTYALISLHSVGDQPGQSTAHYLTPWRPMPVGIYIATNKFPLPVTITPLLAGPFTNDIAFPFPVATNVPPTPQAYHLPYIAFNSIGQLVRGAGLQPNPTLSPEYIPLVRGSIFANPDGTVDVAETHVGDAYYPFNANNITAMNLNSNLDTGSFYSQIYIDPLTGRARVQHLEVQ